VRSEAIAECVGCGAKSTAHEKQHETWHRFTFEVGDGARSTTRVCVFYICLACDPVAQRFIAVFKACLVSVDKLVETRD